MSSPASSKRKRKSGSAPERRGRALAAFALAIIILPGTVWGAEEKYLASIMSGLQSEPTPNAIVLPLADTGNSDANRAVSLVEDAAVQLAHGEMCPFESMAALSLVELPLPAAELLRFIIAPQDNHPLSGPRGDTLSHANTNGVDLLSFARKKMLPRFATTYRGL